jgi:hypothetical protein
MPQSSSSNQTAKSGSPTVTKNDYLSLAAFLQGSDSVQRVSKRDPNGEPVRTAADLYGNREYVPAYECFKPAYEKVVGDMQRVLARNIEFEANKLAQKQRVPIAAAKERVQNIRAHAQQVIDQFDRLMRDLEGKPLVRAHIKKGGTTAAAVESAVVESAVVEPSVVEPPPTTLGSTSETLVEVSVPRPVEIVSGGNRYLKTAYAPPEKNCLYSVRDKAKGERIIRVIAINDNGALIQVEILEDGKQPKPPVQLTVDSLARQAAKGWCSLLVPVAEQKKIVPGASKEANSHFRFVTMRLDSQNFSRCCGDIVRANLKFSTQAIKDVQDGPFRAGNYEQAFLVFEQLAVQFNSAVANSRRAISDARRMLSAEKGRLSGKEIVERTAALVRSENLIHTAEREFSTILEGLRMYLRVQAASENQADA